MNTWNFREQILMAFHRWYWVVASFMLGVLLGWLASLVWPGSYRAVQDIYVGLNAQHATRDLYFTEARVQQFRNLDDYKNWQMEQLNALALSDAFLQETLRRLNLIDADWNSIDVPGLRSMLSIAWRNTGDWHFSAQAEMPAQAESVVSVWTQVVIEEVASAVDAARKMVEIDTRMQAVAAGIKKLASRQVLLDNSYRELAEWETILKNKPSDQLLSPLEHWSLVSRVTIAADWSPGWLEVLDAAPPTNSYPVDYLGWLPQVRALLETEIAMIPAQLEMLNREYDTLAVDYAGYADASRGLSGNLEVEQIKTDSNQTQQIRPTGTMMLVGGFLGLLVWGIIWLVQITRKTE